MLARAGAWCCKWKVVLSEHLTLRLLRSLPASWPPVPPNAAVLLARRALGEGGGERPGEDPVGSLERVICFLPGVVIASILCSLGDEAIAGEGVLGAPSHLFSFGFPHVGLLWI